MKSLGVKLFTPFLAGVLCITLLMTWYTYETLRGHVLRSVLAVSEAKTELVFARIIMHYRALRLMMEENAEDPRVLAAFEGGSEHDAICLGISEWFAALSRGNSCYHGILITDCTGKCLASSEPRQIGEKLAWLETTEGLCAGELTVEGMYFDQSRRVMNFTAAYPIQLNERTVGAFVVVSEFSSIIDNESTNRDIDLTSIFLVRPDGHFSLHDERALLGSMHIELYDNLRTAAAGGASVTYAVNGNEYTGFARLDPISQWMIVTSAPNDAISATAHVAGVVTLGIGFAGIALVSLVILRSTHGVTNALSSLIAYAKRVSEGKNGEKLGATDRADEVGVLHNALALLVERMQGMVEKVNSSSLRRSDFIAKTSHELRNLADSIIGTTGTLLRDPSVGSEHSKAIETIQQTAYSLLGILGDMLDMAKLESGKVSIARNSFEIRRLMNEVVARHDMHAAAKSLDLMGECAPGVPRCFFGDARRVAQILDKLLGNAVKFTPEGRVSLRISMRSQTGTRACVLFAVNDTGIGIEADLLDKLFQPLVQADTSISRRYGGTGLGLTIAHSLALLMGGDIEMESEPGVGSTFTLVLPLEIDYFCVPDREQTDSEVAMDSVNLWGKNIIIADDNLMNQMILEQMISPAHPTILLASNGKEVLDLIDERDVDLVFMDMQMAGMDGWETTRTIRATGFRNPIVAICANDAAPICKEALTAGADICIKRPLEYKPIYEVLKGWLADR